MAQKLTPAQKRIEATFLSMRKNNRIKDISVLELYQKAEVCHSTFYKYYEDIYYLNYAIERREFLCSCKKLIEAKDFDTNYINALIEFYRKYRPLYREDEIYIFIRNIEESLTEIINYIFLDKFIEKKLKNISIFNLVAVNLFRVPMMIICLSVQNEKSELSDEKIALVTRFMEANIQAVFKELFPEINVETDQIRNKIRVALAQSLQNPDSLPPRKNSIKHIN